MEATIRQDRSPAQDTLEKVLVIKAKKYLQQRLRKLAPDAVLTQAWESFYRTYTAVLMRMAREFHLDAEETEDLVQEVWARVIVHLSEFRWHEHGAGLRGWLYTLVRNQALNLLRAKVRHRVRLARAFEMREFADPGPGPEEQWQTCWDRELVRLLLADLAEKVSPLNHRLLVMRWLEGRSLAEVACLLNLSKKQVTYRQLRLFRKLRAALAVYRGEPFFTNSACISWVRETISKEISECAPSARTCGVV